MAYSRSGSQIILCNNTCCISPSATPLPLRHKHEQVARFSVLLLHLFGFWLLPEGGCCRNEFPYILRRVKRAQIPRIVWVHVMLEDEGRNGRALRVAQASRVSSSIYHAIARAPFPCGYAAL